MKTKNLDSKKILKNIERKKKDIRKYGVKKIGLFGSFAKGKQHKKSDVDILVRVGNKMSLLDFVGLKLELEKIVGRKVDLVEYSMIKPRIKENILKEEVKII